MHQELAKSKQPRLEDLAAISSPQAADGVHCVEPGVFFFRSIRSSWSALFRACSCKRMYLVMLLSFNETKCSHGIWSSKSEKRSQFHGARYTWIWCDRDVWLECRESMKMMTLMLGCGRPFVSKVAPYRWHSVFSAHYNICFLSALGERYLCIHTSRLLIARTYKLPEKKRIPRKWLEFTEASYAS